MHIEVYIYIYARMYICTLYMHTLHVLYVSSFDWSVGRSVAWSVGRTIGLATAVRQSGRFRSTSLVAFTYMNMYPYCKCLNSLNKL